MKISKSVALSVILTIFMVNTSKAQNLGDLFGGSGLGDTLGNLIEGVFSSSNITIADMAGEWTANGPAVCFQGEGFLKKAGGAAAAAAIETKLKPYYEQYGLNNSKLNIDQEGNFTLTCKAIRLSGNITRNEKAEPGVFEFNFTALGMKLAGVTTYVQKTSSSMDIMFDATKLKKLLSAVASFTGIQIVQTVSSILDSYDGLAVGSHYTGTSTNNSGSTLGNILGGFGIGGGNQNTQQGTQQGTQNNQNTQPEDSGSGFGLGDILSGFGIGGGGQNTQNNQGTQGTQNNKGKGSQNNQNNSNTQNEQGGDAVSTGIDLLRGVLGGGKKK